MRNMIWAAGLGLGALFAACSPGAGDTKRTSPAQVLGEFRAFVDPSRGVLQFTPGSAATSANGLTAVNVVQDGTPGAGPANSVELISTNLSTDSGVCGGTNRFCGDVLLRSFYTAPLTNAFAVVDSIAPATGHVGLNSDPASMGLSNALGLWSYGTIAASGGSSSRQWIFGDDGTNYWVTGRVMADDVGGGACVDGSTCPSGVCSGGQCQAPTCSDDVMNGDETGIDCGGSCGFCVGHTCAGPEDCATNLCPASVCVAPVGAPPPRPTGTIGDIVRYQDGGSYANLPVTLSGGLSFVFGDNLIILGGIVDGMTSAGIYQATIGSDGLLSAFALSPTYSLVEARSHGRAEVIGGYIYVFGGSGDFGALSSIERAPLGADGIAGPFVTLPQTLQTPRMSFQTLVTSHYVYALGGNWPQLDTIERAPIDASGHLTGDFTELTRTVVDVDTVSDGLVEARWTHGAIRLGDNYYLIGGEGMSSIEKAVIQPDGTIGSFVRQAITLPANRNRPSVIALYGTVYVYGGWDGDFLPSIAASTITNDELGPFSDTGHTLETPCEDGTALLTSTAVYLFGGHQNFWPFELNYIQRALIQ